MTWRQMATLLLLEALFMVVFVAFQLLLHR
jgi:hypothetical protein